MKPSGQITRQRLARLLDQHSRPLELYASQWCTSPQDCVQEAFVGLAALIPPPENEVAWLYRAVRNRAINAARSAQRRDAHEKEGPLLSGQIDNDPAEVAASKEESRRLIEHLNQLDKDHAEIVVLRIWSELTWDQISELTGMSSSNAQRKYVKAIERLGSLMKNNV